MTSKLPLIIINPFCQPIKSNKVKLTVEQTHGNKSKKLTFYETPHNWQSILFSGQRFSSDFSSTPLVPRRKKIRKLRKYNLHTNENKKTQCCRIIILRLYFTVPNTISITQDKVPSHSPHTIKVDCMKRIADVFDHYCKEFPDWYEALTVFIFIPPIAQLHRLSVFACAFPTFATPPLLSFHPETFVV